MSTIDDSRPLRLFGTHLVNLHAKAKAGSLDASEHAEYERIRDDLARMLVFAQQLACRPGEKARQALRAKVESGVKVDGSGLEGRMLDLSAGGFAAIFADAGERGTALPSGEDVTVTLALPYGSPVATRARVVATTKAGSGLRASFAFVGLAPQALARIEVCVFDQVLPQLSSLLAPQ